MNPCAALLLLTLAQLPEGGRPVSIPLPEATPGVSSQALVEFRVLEGWTFPDDRLRPESSVIEGMDTFAFDLILTREEPRGYVRLLKGAGLSEPRVVASPRVVVSAGVTGRIESGETDAPTLTLSVSFEPETPDADALKSAMRFRLDGVVLGQEIAKDATMSNGDTLFLQYPLPEEPKKEGRPPVRRMLVLLATLRVLSPASAPH